MAFSEKTVPDTFIRVSIREKAGIPDTVRFHDLRHTQATLMLAAGIHPKIVQERLGHGDISLTLNTYSHLLAGIQSEAVEKMGVMIPKPKREAVDSEEGSAKDF